MICSTMRLIRSYYKRCDEKNYADENTEDCKFNFNQEYYQHYNKGLRTFEILGLRAQGLKSRILRLQV